MSLTLDAVAACMAKGEREMDGPAVMRALERAERIMGRAAGRRDFVWNAYDGICIAHFMRRMRGARWADPACMVRLCAAIAMHCAFEILEQYDLTIASFAASMGCPDPFSVERCTVRASWWLSGDVMALRDPSLLAARDGPEA